MEVNRLCTKNEFYSENVEERFADISLSKANKKCTEWLKNNCISDDESVLSDCSEASESSLCTNVTNTSEMSCMFENKEILQNKNHYGTLNQLATKLFKEKEPPNYDKVSIYKSKDVHIGDVIVVNGPVTLKSQKPRKSSDLKSNPLYDSFGIVTRTNWLAQPPVSERWLLSEPAKYVIICHTATEEGFTQAENTLLVRLIQTFHIESKKWSDIAYNFLVGSDGLIYEGRGFNYQGAHTKYYNHNSIGIAFIGCFLNHLPPDLSIKKVKDLIEFGVSKGYISKDYHLVGHRQCRSTESPGQKLFEEIQLWDRWDSSVRVVDSLKNVLEC